MLRDSLHSVRTVLRLAHSKAVLVFDGLDGKPSVSRGMRARYAIKIANVLTSLPSVDALVAEAWLHQANSLRCAMVHAMRPRTPLVFVIQDDTQIGPGGSAIELGFIHRMLTQDPIVQYVRFTLHSDCADAKGILMQGYEPCKPHPTSKLLQRTHRWVDRPHFATRRHYFERLFATLPRDAKVTPEQVLDQRSRVDQNWPLWMYGRRNDMGRDLHWPSRVDGTLVSKEFVPSLVKAGRNVSGPVYAHSYLIHAYRGRTQDVGVQQISQRAFRTHNPNMWTQADRLTKADER